ncbi:aluminum-activated malate transporter 8-like [Neltuma alba]|uniref:aluminum-activated malate transporter 8-like n=1 Tax=Neltuma alba TaxID=207710 RepID=UPI0010A58913|nr:aluminum-activated malate transporter 8-like [Prosopis alba]XP_028808340.1 aluminum-activated malate transporter 8-like [Prosopis alba]
MASPVAENATHYSASRGIMQRLRSLPGKLLDTLAIFGKKLAKIAKDDPRRVTHSLKVGLALTVVSLFFFLRRLYDSFGDNAIWAVMTVVVVMEFSVGATLGKGLNRMLATLLGGFLGAAVQKLSTLSGEKEKPVLISLFLYIIGALITFMRFVPQVKARYDYGLTIFILTFSLVSVSGYRDDQILDLAFKRLSTIIIGSFIAIIICVFLFPVWSGDDLHNLLASNLEKLGNFLEGFGTDLQPKHSERSFAKEYESVLTSKTREETLANFARWEPCHGQIRFRHPWQRYLELGNLTRQCAYKAEALDVYLRSLILTSNQVGISIKDSCQSASLECGKALKVLSSSVKSMTCLTSTTAKARVAKAKRSIELIHSLLRSEPYWEGVELTEIVAAAAVTSLLSDVIICIESIIEAVDELSSLAHFKRTVHSPPVTATNSKLQPLAREGILKPVLESHELRYCAVTINDGYSSTLTKEIAKVLHP